MSANANVLHTSEVMGSSAREAALPLVQAACDDHLWNPEDFAHEQILGLVRRVFFAKDDRPVKQIVLSAAEPNLEIASICGRVALSLAHQTRGSVALVDTGESAVETAHPRGNVSIKSSSAQIGINLWRVPKSRFGGCRADSGTALQWLPCLEELRKEFEYSVIQGPAGGTTSEAALLGQLTDGIILVLGAQRTRRATARQIKETLEGAQCRILGTVLMERTFPIPERLYRRL